MIKNHKEYLESKSVEQLEALVNNWMNAMCNVQNLPIIATIRDQIFEVNEIIRRKKSERQS
jgi:hypothetical protein